MDAYKQKAREICEAAAKPRKRKRKTLSQRRSVLAGQYMDDGMTWDAAQRRAREVLSR